MEVVLYDLPAVRSFTGFLAQHGQHQRQLTLHCQDGTAEGEVAAAAAFAACLAITGAGGQLVELVAIGCIRSTDWLAAMRSLRRLRLEAHPHESRLHMSPAIHVLTALSELELEGRLVIPAATHLPPSLKRLTLRWDDSDALPEQVAELPRLASLCLEHCAYSADSFGALLRLSSSLTCLSMDCATIPGSLSALTQLLDLRLEDCWAPEGDNAVLSAALPHLTQLTRLNLETADAAVPAALSGLSNLQCCYLDLLVSEEGGVAPPLPAGPWLASLRWLHYNVDGLARSTTSLRAASALDFLEGGALDNSQKVVWSCPAAAAFFDWLAQHPPLRRVYFDAAGSPVFDSGFFAAHAMRLARRRPSLELEGFLRPIGDAASMLDLIQRS